MAPRSAAKVAAEKPAKKSELSLSRLLLILELQFQPSPPVEAPKRSCRCLINSWYVYCTFVVVVTSLIDFLSHIATGNDSPEGDGTRYGTQRQVRTPVLLSPHPSLQRYVSGRFKLATTNWKTSKENPKVT